MLHPSGLDLAAVHPKEQNKSEQIVNFRSPHFFVRTVNANNDDIKIFDHICFNYLYYIILKYIIYPLNKVIKLINGSFMMNIL